MSTDPRHREPAIPAGPVPADSRPALDVEVVTGHIRTMDPDRPEAEAIAIRGDRIVAVGSIEEVTASLPAHTPTRSVSGTIVPGLIDTHIHLQRGGLKMLHDLGPGPHELDTVIAHMRDHGFEDGWGGEPPTPDERVEAMARIQPLMHQLGITGIIDPAATPDEMAGYQESWRRRALTVRVLAMPYLDLGEGDDTAIDDAIRRLEGYGITTGFGDEHLRVGAIKVYLDGEAMKSQALLAAPWPEHGCKGHQRLAVEQLERLARFCATAGWSVGVHAVGGAAIDQTLDCFEAADAEASIAGRQWQVIHAYLEVNPEAMARAARLDVAVAAQPSITLRNGRQLLEALGDRAETMNPLRSWIDAGARVVMGSDGPFFPFDPRELMWSAVTRRMRHLDDPVGPGEAIDAAEALAGYTREAAMVAFAGDRRGVLSEGRLADWAIFDRDPLGIDPEELPGLSVTETVVGGTVVYDARRPNA